MTRHVIFFFSFVLWAACSHAQGSANPMLRASPVEIYLAVIVVLIGVLAGFMSYTRKLHKARNAAFKELSCHKEQQQQHWDKMLSVAKELAHDIRQPLSASIQSMHDDNEVSTEARKWLGKHVVRLQHVRNVVDNLLDELMHVRSECDIPMLGVQCSRLRDELGYVRELADDLFSKRELQAAISIVDPSVLDQFVVTTVFKRCIDNIITNAGKYAKRGTQVGIAFKRDGRSLVIEVQNACGDLSADDIKRSGTKLGMNGTESLVLRHKGKFAAERMQNVYLVTVNLPFINQHSQPPISCLGTKVLVADDDPGVATLLFRRLQTYGLSVSYVPDKEVIAHRLTTEHFDALVTDLSFYRTFDAVKTIRNISKQFPLLPIIGMSEAPQEMVLAQFPDAGALFHKMVQKDDSMSAVAAIVASTLNNTVVSDDGELNELPAPYLPLLNNTLLYRLSENTPSDIFSSIEREGIALHSISEANIDRLPTDGFVLVDLTVASGLSTLSSLQYARCTVVAISDLPQELVKLTFSLPDMARIIVQCHGDHERSAREIIATVAALCLTPTSPRHPMLV